MRRLGTFKLLGVGYDLRLEVVMDSDFGKDSMGRGLSVWDGCKSLRARG